MYHQLGRMSGRLVAATHLQNPLFPIAPVALQRVEPPKIVYNTNQMSTVSEACPTTSRPKRLIPGTNIPFPPVSEEIKRKQELFQKDNGVPVFLKGGPFDAVLYRFTMLLCIVGLMGFAHTIYGHAVPKK
ncbi:uncharacterized protein LOC121736381 [Aricia agestis]|uniref:uncharacterized protein LOC121736381 n=1 Tax=Aricia agestis TaxID=91739 RepID=UPI001C208620|nr:uncharacterized protein LOC121736381 [Aricia agestis]